MWLLGRLVALLCLLTSPALAQTDSYLALNGTFKTPFALANTWSAVQTYTVAPVFNVLPSTPLAQFQILQGNGSGVAAPVTFSAAIDAAIGATRGSILERTSTGWQLLVPCSTVGFPLVFNGVGADPGCQALTAAGIAAATITTTQIAANTVANSNLATMAANTAKGSIAGGTPVDLTTTQLTTLCNVFTSGLSGCVPASGGGAVNFLRADGTWTTPTNSLGATTVQRFTSGTSLTYTPTVGTLRARIRIAGGGGGGGGTTTGGGTGGTTSFGSWTAIGGTGGPFAGAGGSPGGAGGSGGANGTGTLAARFSGGGGSAGVGNNANVGGSGGNNPFGGGGSAGASSTAAVAGAPNTGAGGGGTGTAASSGQGGGGAGEYVEFWMTSAQIGASQTYTVGAAGAAGTGTSPAAGAAGVIIIEEFPF